MLDGARSPMADTHTIPVICSPGQPRHTHPYREPTHTYLPLHLSCPLGVCVCGSYLSISSHQKAVVKIQEPQDTLTLTLPPPPPSSLHENPSQSCAPPLALFPEEGQRGCWKGRFQGEDTIPGQKQQLEWGPSGQSSVTAREQSCPLSLSRVQQGGDKAGEGR